MKSTKLAPNAPWLGGASFSITLHFWGVQDFSMKLVNLMTLKVVRQVQSRVGSAGVWPWWVVGVWCVAVGV